MKLFKKPVLLLCSGLTLLGNSATAMNFNFDNQTFDEFNKVTNNLRTLGQFVSETALPQIDHTLGSFNQTLVNTNYTIEKIQPMVLDVTATVNKALDFAGNKKKLRLFTKFLNENAGTIDNTLGNVDKTIAGVNATIKEGQKLVKDGDKLLDKGDKLFNKGEKLAKKFENIDPKNAVSNAMDSVSFGNQSFRWFVATSAGVVTILVAVGTTVYKVASYGFDKFKESYL